MRIEIGKENQFLRHRLNDVIFLAEQTEPVDSRYFGILDWEGYAKANNKFIAQQAREALAALDALTLTDERHD